MDTILVTGANGFVGSNILAQIDKNNYKVVALDIAFREKKYDNVDYAVVDITNLEELGNLFEKYKFSSIVHLSGIIGKKEDEKTVDLINNVNIKGTSNIAFFANKYNSHAIFFSSGLVYGAQKGPFLESMDLYPVNYYGLSKKMGEEFLQYYKRKEGNFLYTILRPSIIYGPRQKGEMFIPSLVSSYRNNEKFKMTKGEQTRDFIFIDDVVDAVLIVLYKKIGGIYNLSFGKSYKMVDVAKEILKIVDMDIEIGGLDYRENEIWDYSLSNKKLLQSDWVPKVPLNEGLKECVLIER